MQPQNKSQNGHHFDVLFKYIIVGSINCGKTSLLGRFLKPDQKWTDHYQPTLGLQFGSKTIHAKNKLCKIMVWDTAGQQIFRSIIRSYYKGAIVCLLTFDITDHSSFESCKDWLQEVRSNSHQQLKIYLIGNKCDLEFNRGVSIAEAQELVENMGLCRYFQTSAKQNTNVQQFFQQTVIDILDDIQANKIIVSAQENIGIKINYSSQDPSQSPKKVVLSQHQPQNSNQNQSCKC